MKKSSIKFKQIDINLRKNCKQGAIDQYHDHFKNIDKVLENNKLEKVKHSLFTSMIVKSNQKLLFPCKIGLVKDSGKDDVVDIRKMRYGNQYIEVLAAGLKESNDIE